MHRDIKPANVLVDDRGLSSWPISEHPRNGVVVRSGAVRISSALVGTPYYMAPEVVSSEKGTGDSRLTFGRR